MLLKDKKIAFCVTGSFCTLARITEDIKKLKETEADIYPVLSPNVKNMDTRFGKAMDFINNIEDITGKKIMCEIQEVEPFGPKHLMDVVIVAPCTGNTLAKIASGISDNAVTLACKAHLRNEEPVVIAPSTNDGLAANAYNFARLINRKNIYFVPFKQDNPEKKPSSLVADFSMLIPTLEKALDGEQTQPILL